MRRFNRAAAMVAFCLVAILVALPIWAGTQDFVLVNDTGDTIERIYISETSNDDWEEDVLGRNILEDGERLDMSFRGRRACLWDIKAEDEDGDSIEFTAINLCEVSVVVLICDKNECWAEYE